MKINFGNAPQNISKAASKFVKNYTGKIETLNPDKFEELSKNAQGIASAVKQSSGNWMAFGLDKFEELSKNAQGIFGAVKK